MAVSSAKAAMTKVLIYVQVSKREGRMERQDLLFSGLSETERAITEERAQH